MDWREDYQKKLITSVEAANMVKSGDRIAIAQGSPTIMAIQILAGRLDELENVEIHGVPVPFDYAFIEPGFEKVFGVTLYFVHTQTRQMADEKRADYCPLLYSLYGKAEAEGRPGIKSADIFFVVVSPPDEDGYCYYGNSVWAKKSYTKSARKVIAQVDDRLIKCYGDCRVHVSEIDHFVEDVEPTVEPEMTPELRRILYPEPDETAKAIGEYVATLVKNGDTIGIGFGSIGVTLIPQGIFDDRKDLGYYAENIVPGVVRLVKEGVITGKRKNFHPGVPVVVNNLTDRDNLDFIDNNPMFELYPQEYVLDIRNVAANDNMVNILSALSIDFTGQIASESIGHRMYSGSGGQPEMAIGAMLSKGGRSIIVLRATTSDGKASRIVPSLEPGTIVTVPRNFADYVVTEYGIASLHGKTQRERALELIAIAHPDFRAGLKKQVQELFWP